MAKRSVSASGPVSRSGLWLIGGTLVFAAAVLVWAFRDDQRPTTVSRRPTTNDRSASSKLQAPSSKFTARSQEPGAGSQGPRGEALARLPEVTAYAPLLQRNLFRPLVTSGLSREPGAASAKPQAGPKLRPGRPDPPAATGPEVVDAWRGWQFGGVAQLGPKTYALMDQPGKKRSRFVRPGDRLEDATVAHVTPDEVALREAAGRLVRVRRFDVMADLLRSSPSAAPRSVGSPAGPPTGPASPAAPGAAPPTVRRAPVGFDLDQSVAGQTEGRDPELEPATSEEL